ncbi:hypothetical protein [Streptomyces sp. NPDC088725]|uniref:hypothetical protein n=1 Tax=Streptomyces sp. NPDC088725 TaxID=3365873 RepID=UPI003803B656
MMFKQLETPRERIAMSLAEEQGFMVEKKELSENELQLISAAGDGDGIGFLPPEPEPDLTPQGDMENPDPLWVFQQIDHDMSGQWNESGIFPDFFGVDEAAPAPAEQEPTPTQQEPAPTETGDDTGSNDSWWNPQHLPGEL